MCMHEHVLVCVCVGGESVCVRGESVCVRGESVCVRGESVCVRGEVYVNVVKVYVYVVKVHEYVCVRVSMHTCVLLFEYPLRYVCERVPLMNLCTFKYDNMEMCTSCV